jgi:hypothetical protein
MGAKIEPTYGFYAHQLTDAPSDLTDDRFELICEKWDR